MLCHQSTYFTGLVSVSRYHTSAVAIAANIAMARKAAFSPARCQTIPLNAVLTDAAMPVIIPLSLIHI